jgi:hypothetical protein
MNIKQRIDRKGAVQEAGAAFIFASGWHDACQWLPHFTVDGSEPGATSTLYTQPLSLFQSTRIRALLLRDGQPFLMTEENFSKGEKPRAIDPRWQKESDLSRAPSMHTWSAYGRMEARRMRQDRMAL